MNAIHIRFADSNYLNSSRICLQSALHARRMKMGELKLVIEVCLLSYFSVEKQISEQFQRPQGSPFLQDDGLVEGIMGFGGFDLLWLCLQGDCTSCTRDHAIPATNTPACVDVRSLLC